MWVGRSKIIPYHDGWKRKLVKAGNTLMQDGPKRKLVMAGEAPMLVQLVLLPQMRLVVLLVPQVRPLVLRRRVYYHVTYFAFAMTPLDRLSNNVLARICSSISRTSISASL